MKLPENFRLAEKYRPKTLRHMIGQARAKMQIIRFVLSLNRHLALLIGPTGQGKTSMARTLPKLLVCKRVSSENPDACGVCDDCVDVEKNPDSYILEVHCGNITPEELRYRLETFQDHLMMRAKVLFLDEFGFITKTELGILLAIIDEFLQQQDTRLQRSIIVLATTPELLPKILESINSRSAIIRFSKISEDDMARGLISIAEQEGLEYDPEAIQAIAGAAEFGMRNAVNMLQDVMEENLPITEELVNKVHQVPKEVEFIEIFHSLNTDPRQVYEKTEHLLSLTEAPSFRSGLLKSFNALYRISTRLPIGRKISAPLTKRYKDLGETYHPTEFQIMMDCLYARRFVEIDSPNVLMNLILGLSYRLCKIEFRELTTVELEDRMLAQQNKRKRRRYAL